MPTHIFLVLINSFSQNARKSAILARTTQRKQAKGGQDASRDGTSQEDKEGLPAFMQSIVDENRITSERMV